MKKKRLFWLFLGFMSMNFAITSVVSAQDRWRGERREESRERWHDRDESPGRLVGRWYKDGAPCEIVYTRDGLEARNEYGDRSRLVHDPDGRLRALDWEGGLRGNIRGNRIVWANGSSWSR